VRAILELPSSGSRKTFVGAVCSRVQVGLGNVDGGQKPDGHPLDEGSRKSYDFRYLAANAYECVAIAWRISNSLLSSPALIDD
jgi:hypothetical protein